MDVVMINNTISIATTAARQQENAVVISPAYRLLPDADRSDILNDVQDFWTWVREPYRTSPWILTLLLYLEKILEVIYHYSRHLFIPRRR